MEVSSSEVHQLPMERLPQGGRAVLHAAAVFISDRARWWKMWRKASTKSG
nr:MAG TPA: hypothetical protein [Caudoviricetes sp.]